MINCNRFRLVQISPSGLSGNGTRMISSHISVPTIRPVLKTFQFLSCLSRLFLAIVSCVFSALTVFK